MDTIFKEGSKTFYNSSRFFPHKIRKDVMNIYGLVRVADDYVDSVPQKKKEFYDFWEMYKTGLKKGYSENEVINSFLGVMKRKKFKKEWVDSFFKSMEMDIKKNKYRNMKELDKYLYGSCEVVGLMMAKVMNLPKEAEISSRYLGRGMQYINFIRDIKEDIKIGRNYFPQDDVKSCGIREISYEELKKKPENFKKCVRKQICRYFEWRDLGRRGFYYIPRRLLIPIKTASDMYTWTAKKIYDDPFIVFREKVRPSKIFIIYTGIKNLINPYPKNSIKKDKKCT